MIGPTTAILASQSGVLNEQRYQELFPYVIREVAERGGHGFYGANESGDVELSAAYRRAIRKGLVEFIPSRGFLHRISRMLKFTPIMEPTDKGWIAYGEVKAQEKRGEIEPNRYH